MLVSSWPHAKQIQPVAPSSCTQKRDIGGSNQPAVVGDCTPTLESSGWYIGCAPVVTPKHSMSVVEVKLNTLAMPSGRHSFRELPSPTMQQMRDGTWSTTPSLDRFPTPTACATKPASPGSGRITYVWLPGWPRAKRAGKDGSRIDGAAVLPEARGTWGDDAHWPLHGAAQHGATSRGRGPGPGCDRLIDTARERGAVVHSPGRTNDHVCHVLPDVAAGRPGPIDRSIGTSSCDL